MARTLPNDPVEVLAGFDYITPVWATLNDAVRGPHFVFMVDDDYSPLSARDTGLYLGRNNVESWGYLIIGGTLMFSVAESDGKRAEFLLRRAGVPVEGVY